MPTVPQKPLKDKLEKLHTVLELIDADKPSYSDLAKYFAQLSKALQAHAVKIDALLAQSEKNTVKELDKFVKQIEKYRLEKKGENGRDGVNGTNGKDADEEKIISEVSDTLERNLPQYGEQFRDGLELLKDEERLDASAIKNLEKIIKGLMGDVKFKTITVGGGGGGASVGGGRTVKSYDLSASLNGSTRTFATPAMWRVISVHLSSFPNILRETIDYTWTPQSLTITSEISDSSISSGQTLILVYAE